MCTNVKWKYKIYSVVHFNKGNIIGNMSSSSRTEYNVDVFDKPELRGFEITPVAELFFSKDNLDALQHGIRYRVFVESGQKQYNIARQSDRELTIIMRSIYLQESMNNPNNILEQVRELNRLVIKFCVPRIIGDIDMYMTYQHDISHQPIPMARGEIASNKGSKSLEMWKIA